MSFKLDTLRIVKAQSIFYGPGAGLKAKTQTLHCPNIFIFIKALHFCTFIYFFEFLLYRL